MNRRVVITGIGLVTPLGVGREATWAALLNGQSGIRPFESFDASRLKARFGGEVRGFDPLEFLDKPSARRSDRYAQLAIAAADEAVEDAALGGSDQPAGNLKLPPELSSRVGVLLGVALGGLGSLEHNFRQLLARGPERLSPYTVPMMLANTAPGMFAIRYGTRGPNYTLTSACASSSHAIGEAAELIQRDLCTAVITGGVESTLTEFCVGSFAAMRALSTRNAEPERASRPFAVGRDGFVISEGAGVLVLEELEHAKNRGARLYAEVLGWGSSADAHHITSPDPDGAGVIQALEQALEAAGLTPADIDHVNAHATSTPLGDAAEAKALHHVFGDHTERIWVTAPKSMLGHTLGAAGGVEGSITALSLSRGVIPPTINCEEQDADCPVRVAKARTVAPIQVAINNSFGFGGTNSSLVLGRCS